MPGTLNRTPASVARIAFLIAFSFFVSGHLKGARVARIAFLTWSSAFFLGFVLRRPSTFPRPVERLLLSHILTRGRAN